MTMEQELMTVVDANDVVLGYSSKEDIRKRGLNFRVVQVFVFNDTGELLLCKRPETKKVYAKQYAAVMGRVRRGEGYADAAERLVREELGMRTKVRKAAKFSIFSGASRVFQEVYSAEASGKIKPDKKEISETRPISTRDLREQIVTHPQKFAPPFIEAARAYMKAKNVY